MKLSRLRSPGLRFDQSPRSNALRLLVTAACGSARAQAPSTKPTDKPDAKPAAKQAESLAVSQQRLAERYRQLEDLLLRMAELSATTDPRRVALHDNWPDVYPLRKDFRLETVLPPFEGERHIYRPALGEGVLQVPVGPVHAGVIEPGHFRFSCSGETVLHLEISLGYQHRGVERVLINGPTPRTASRRRSLKVPMPVPPMFSCVALTPRALSATSPKFQPSPYR